MKEEIETAHGSLRAAFAAKLGGDSSGDTYFWDGETLMASVVTGEFRSFSLWGKDGGHRCSVTTRKIHKFSAEELNAAMLLQQQSDAACEKERQAVEKRDGEIASWIANLPETVDGWRINKDRKEIEFPNGEYYLPLPSAPVGDLGKWIRDNEYVPE